MSVTTDATSGGAIPQTAAEWTSLLSGHGINNPFLLYRCQEASGNLIDSISGVAQMGAVGSPSYQQTVAGWASKAVHITNGNCFFNTDSSLPDISSTSVMLFAWVKTPANFTTGTYVLAFGTTYHHQVGWFSSTVAGGTQHVGVGFATTGGFSGGVPQGSVDQRAQVLPVLVQWVVGTGTITVQTSLETVQAVGVTSTPTGKEIMFGANNGANTDPGEDLEILYASVWHGADAEIDAGHRATLISLMTTPAPSPVSVTVAPSTETLVLGGATGALTATEHFSDSSTVDVTSTATWTSANTGVATVAAGVVTAVAVGGPINITATKDGALGHERDLRDPRADVDRDRPGRRHRPHGRRSPRATHRHGVVQ